ncbi:MAG: MobA/MobL family protein [Pseudomonadota bacterium]
MAGAAYRAGENLKGIGQGKDGGDKWHRYTNRASVVRETFFMTPDGKAPDYIPDDGAAPAELRKARAQLWNEIEAMEKGPTARLGRELQLGFAHELSHDEQRELVREFVRERFTDGGKATVLIHGKPVEVNLSFVVDIAIHDYGRAIPAIGASDEQRAKLSRLADDGYTFVERDEAAGMETPHIRIDRNNDGEVTGYRVYQPHAHVRITPRAFGEGSWDANKHASRALNGHDVCKDWRYDWPKLQNEYLERAGSDMRVTCTSEFEDDAPNIRFLGSGRSHEVEHIAQRNETVAQQADDAPRNKHDEAEEKRELAKEFNEIHNAAMHQSAADATASARDEADRETVRTTTWWRNMSERFHTWRGDFAEKAEEWRERFKAQEQRLKSVFGWYEQAHEQPPPDAPEPDDTPQPEEPER